jgi:hypothetical protein
MTEIPPTTATSVETGSVVRGSSIRPLARILSEPLAVWAMASDGRIIYASAACGSWLRVGPETLVGRGAADDVGSQEGIDALARSLKPVLIPVADDLAIAGVHDSRAFVRNVHPPLVVPATAGQLPPETRPTLFVPIPDDRGIAYLAIAGIEIENEGGPQRNNHSRLSAGEFAALIDSLQRQLAMDSRQLLAPITLGGSFWAGRLQRQIRAAAEVASHVTLHCSSGGGGETVARLIHAHAVDSKKHVGKTDLVKVAGALMDAELFDATTGGLISQFLERPDNHAALLVMDLDQMPADAQQRLALLVHNFNQRLRVFATTTIPPHELARLLVPELATELGLIEIFIPALSQRVEDIPVIAAAILHRRQATGETTAQQIGREVLDRMVLYPWPGNYDELDAAIRSAVRQCRGETLRVEHLPLAIRSYGHIDPTVQEAQAIKAKILPLDQALADAERRLITAALERADGNRAAAARLLEISRARLLRRLEQLGISK